MEIEEDEDIFYAGDGFSQLLKDLADEPDSSKITEATVDSTSTFSTKNSVLDSFEEAFTVLKSIHSIHHPISFTAMTAYLFHLRRPYRSYNTKRTLEGLVWPEHPETFENTRLLSETFKTNLKPTDYQPQNQSNKLTAPFDYPGALKRKLNLSELSSSEDEDEDENESEDDKNLNGLEFRPSLCELSQSLELHSALKRACQSIWEQRIQKIKFAHATCTDNDAETSNEYIDKPSSIIDPRLSHLIARRTSILLEALLSRSILTHRSATKILKSKINISDGDIENVPIDWCSVGKAAEQLIGQVALDRESFSRFSSRLDKTFKNKK